FDHAMRASATSAAAHLFPHFPAARTLRAMFTALARDFEARGTAPLACKLEPRLAAVHPHDQLGAANEIGAELLVALFQGALLEHGAKVAPSLGAPCIVLELNGTSIEAESVARDAMSDTAARERLLRWAARFESEAPLVAQAPSSPEHA